MVNHVLRLKLALLASAFRPGVALARTSGVVALSVMVAVALIWLSGEVDVALESHRASLVIVATAVSIGIAVAPVSAGLGSALEPSRFAAFPVPPRTLALGLGVAAAVGVPGLLAALLGISLERAWSGEPAVVGAVVAGVLAAVSIVIVSQYLVVVADRLSFSTRARRTVTVGARVVIALALAVGVTTVLGVVSGADDATLVALAGVLAATPLGMLWAAPGLEPGPMSVTLVAGLAIVAGLAWGWGVLVSRVLESPGRRHREGSASTLGWFDVVPATPSGVIAARSLLYWTSDSRYRAVLVGLPLAPVAMMLAFALAGAPLPPLWLLPLPVLALLLGWFSHNDVAYDHSAIWLHVAAPLRGSADRWGRAVPPLLLGVPVILAFAPLFAVWSGVDDVLPALIGTSLGLLLTGLGVSSVASAIGAYPAARPGAGPFDQPPSLEARAGWSQALSLLAIVALMAPALVFLWWGFGDAAWFAVAGVTGAITGVIALPAGIAIGGRAFRRTSPDLLDMMLRT